MLILFFILPLFFLCSFLFFSPSGPAAGAGPGSGSSVSDGAASASAKPSSASAVERTPKSPGGGGAKRSAAAARTPPRAAGAGATAAAAARRGSRSAARPRKLAAFRDEHPFELSSQTKALADLRKAICGVLSFKDSVKFDEARSKAIVAGFLDVDEALETNEATLSASPRVALDVVHACLRSAKLATIAGVDAALFVPVAKAAFEQIAHVNYFNSALAFDHDALQVSFFYLPLHFTRILLTV